MSQALDFLNGDAVTVARGLIGWRFYVVQTNGSKVGGEIIETEAYNQEDAASHSFNGPTKRTQVMFGPPGYLYVYFTYGMHWCMNIVTGSNGQGEAVLIRGLKLDQGLDLARVRRGNVVDSELTNGPAKLCQALQITGKDSGAKIDGKRFLLLPPVSKFKVKTTKRIGISRDQHRLWRFVVSQSDSQN